MMQIIDGLSVYVVEFDTMPALPIIGLTASEQACLNITGGSGLSHTKLVDLTRKFTYAEALTDAIETKVITEPGKYGICLDSDKGDYSICKFGE